MLVVQPPQSPPSPPLPRRGLAHVTPARVCTCTLLPLYRTLRRVGASGVVGRLQDAADAAVAPVTVGSPRARGHNEAGSSCHRHPRGLVSEPPAVARTVPRDLELALGGGGVHWEYLRCTAAGERGGARGHTHEASWGTTAS